MLPASKQALSLERGLHLVEHAERHVVGGIKRMNLLDDPACFPCFFTAARGAFAWDVDGNRYIDLIAGKGAVLLGYADERVDGEVCAAVKSGSLLPLTSTLYPELAERLCGAVESLERTKFFRSGSEALSAAVRLCRMFSDRAKILTCGYHGWHDWATVDKSSKDDSPVVEFYYDLDRLATLLARFADDTAAVVVTPEPALVAPSFILDVELLARDAGVLFVLDEVKTGFRFGLGGYQDLVGVRPDLSTFGKALANGYALTAVGGRADVMGAERLTHISGTYETENVGLAAALATVSVLAESDYGALADMYSVLGDHLNVLFAEHRIGARCFVAEANAHVVFDSDDDAVDFYRAAAAAGVLFYCFDDVNLMYAHVNIWDELLDRLASAARSVSPRSKNLSASALQRYLARHRIIPRDAEAGLPLIRSLLAR